MMRVLLLGGSGQLGCCLHDRRPSDWDLHAPASNQIDVRDELSVDEAVAHFRPDLVINAAAYNQVDQAEREPDTAYAVNAVGAGFVARAAARAGARLIHVSTDYVFDGRQDGRPATRPYPEDAAPNPLNVYGASKRQGELAVLGAHPGATVLRTAWLFSEHGRNFARTILRLVRAGKPLRVVDDQVGTPTYAGDLAQAIIHLSGVDGLVDTDALPGGIYHFSGAEAMSWHQFACRIVQGSGHGQSSVAIVKPIPSCDYPAAAQRPSYSALSCKKMRALGVPPQPLAAGLERVWRCEAGSQASQPSQPT